jgi:agmatine deiminase
VGDNMIPDSETNCLYLASQLPERYPAMWQSLEEILKTHEVEFHLLKGANDIWLRDFLPIQIGATGFVKFRYEPDYLRNGYRHLITGENICEWIPHLPRYQVSEINLDGGNVVASRNQIILTDKIYLENRAYTRSRLRQELANLFQVDQCIIIPKEAFDPVGHSDGIVRFIGDDVVLINDYTAVDQKYGDRLKAVLRKHKLRYEELPHFLENTSHDGIPSAVGNYVNFLRIGSLLIVPAYGAPQDEESLRRLEKLLPQTTVVQVPCRQLAQEGGVLNCISWTIRSDRCNEKCG